MEVITLKSDQFKLVRSKHLLLLDNKMKAVRRMTPDEEAEMKAHNQEQRALSRAAQQFQKKFEIKPFQIFDENEEAYTIKQEGELVEYRIMMEAGHDVMLKQPNGKYWKVLRHPGIKRPSIEDMKRTVPKPEFCDCKEIPGRVPGRHHHLCQYNVMAPENERAFTEKDFEEPETIEEKAELIETIKKEGQGYVSYKDCECRNMIKPKDAEARDHHPACSWFGVSEYRLLRVKGDKFLRYATKDEAKVAKERLEKDATPEIEVDEIACYVEFTNDSSSNE